MKTMLTLMLLGAVALSACASVPQSPELGGGAWVLTSLDGNTQVGSAAGGNDITLQFGEDGRAGGSGGCNQYGAGYTVSGNMLTFEQPVLTLMYCEPELTMQNEAAYLQALTMVGEWQINGSTLTLTGGGHTLVFTR
ncbi:MAG: META domain-containing protein [Anaerolineales bacterium]|nr:MAG: META domain-containing protein [Anaerolineales bacterium]